MKTKWVLKLSLALAPLLLMSLDTGLAALPDLAANEDSWNIECVDCPKQFSSMGDRSLRLDAAGRPHIAYGDDHLYYAWYDGTSWITETVDDAPRVGRTASLALDGSGFPHISYTDGPNYDLKYAYRDADGWHIQTVDNEGIVGWHTSLALDGSGFPHISYYDYTNNDLKYAYLDADGWHIQTVDSERDSWYIHLPGAGRGRLPSHQLHGGLSRDIPPILPSTA